MNIFNIIKEELGKNVMTFYHGGDLDSINYKFVTKKGNYEFGFGLYLTDTYEVVKKYTKGSRKLYLVEVEYGNDIKNSFIKYEDAIDFIKTYALRSSVKDILTYINKWNENGKVPADVFNNLLLNHNAIKGKNQLNLKDFLVKNGIDYEIDDNTFRFGDTTLILYNLRKVVSIKRLTGKYEIIPKIKNSFK